MLSLKKLTKKFGKKTAISDVSLTIGKGEIYCLIGPNGSGKTTTIKIIAGLLRPTSGTVSIAGTDVLQDPVAAKASLGYIPDEPSIWSGMTGEEFLNFSGALYGLNKKVRAERIHSWLDDFHLQGIEREYFENYSRGNKQKFTIIAAMMHEPKALLIDEPIVGLDPTSAEIATQKFLAFAERGGAMLLATHTLPVAQEIATWIGVLDEGRILATGSLDELRKIANLSAGSSLEEIYHAVTGK